MRSPPEGSTALWPKVRENSVNVINNATVTAGQSGATASGDACPGFDIGSGWTGSEQRAEYGAGGVGEKSAAGAGQAAVLQQFALFGDAEQSTLSYRIK